jgi:cytochrome P450
MTLYPEVQAKAQAELDAVVGTGRLPSFSDRADLPYIDALFKEVLRWHQATPIGSQYLWFLPVRLY